MKLNIQITTGDDTPTHSSSVSEGVGNIITVVAHKVLEFIGDLDEKVESIREASREVARGKTTGDQSASG